MSMSTIHTERQRQIVETTVRLLGDLPIGEVTTRRIAAEIGVSQPALFHHFASREDLFLAVVERLQGDLAAIAAAALDGSGGPLDALERLVVGLADLAAATPALPRMVFQDLAGEWASHRDAVRHLHAMQRALMIDLVGRAVACGDLPDRLDVASATGVLVASLQGCLMQGLLGAHDPRPLARAALRVWRAGALAGQPERAGQAPDLAAPAAGDTSEAYLDVGPLLRAGQDPLGAVLRAWEAQSSPRILEIRAPFRPDPLIRLFQARGATVWAVCDAAWSVWFAEAQVPPPVDLRDLPAPEPLEAVLRDTAMLARGAVFTALVPRIPTLLLARLADRGLRHRATLRDEGALLVVWRDAAETT